MENETKHIKLKPFDIVLVQWNDAVTNPSQIPLKKAKLETLAENQTVGFLIKEHKNTIIIADQISSTESISFTSVIPHSLITKISKLTITKDGVLNK